MIAAPTLWLDNCVDVSDAQGPNIDWPAVAAAGITDAFLKATEGHTFAARTFEKNRKGALATRMITVYPYDFLRPGYEAESIAFFTKVAGLGKGSLSMLDWEGRAADTCSPQEAEDIGETIFALTGRYPVGYWGKDGSTPRPPTAKMRKWPRNVPAYPRPGITAFSQLGQTLQANPHSHWPGALFAQYTPTGVVPGIAGPVDRSIFVGTAADLIAWHATGAMPAGFP